jgi:hypothetical protein
MQLFKDNRAVHQQKETGHATHQNYSANGIVYSSWGTFSVLYFRLLLVSLCSTFLSYFLNGRVIEGNLTQNVLLDFLDKLCL